jgi:hypothetical protein
MTYLLLCYKHHQCEYEWQSWLPCLMLCSVVCDYQYSAEPYCLHLQGTRLCNVTTQKAIDIFTAVRNSHFSMNLSKKVVEDRNYGLFQKYYPGMCLNWLRKTSTSDDLLHGLKRQNWEVSISMGQQILATPPCLCICWTLNLADAYRVLQQISLFLKLGKVADADSNCTLLATSCIFMGNSKPSISWKV